jgi:hypothetical protein
MQTTIISKSGFNVKYFLNLKPEYSLCLSASPDDNSRYQQKQYDCHLIEQTTPTPQRCRYDEIARNPQDKGEMKQKQMSIKKRRVRRLYT